MNEFSGNLIVMSSTHLLLFEALEHDGRNEFNVLFDRIFETNLLGSLSEILSGTSIAIHR